MTLDGIAPTLGNAEAAIALVKKMAKVEGCGEWLAQGVAAIAERYPGSQAICHACQGAWKCLPTTPMLPKVLRWLMPSLSAAPATCVGRRWVSCLPGRPTL